MTIGDRIKNKRTEIGMSQVDLAKKIKSSKQTLHKYESNIVTNIPYDKIVALSEIFGCSPAYLMGWDEFSDDDAILDVKISKDFELKQAIRKYYSLDGKKRKYILELIDLLSE